jgi:type VI secretion system secreted protein Hcp
MTELGTTRRDVLRGGALGVGALGVGAMTGALAPAQADAAATTTEEFFLELPGIAGPSTTKGFEKQIPVSSYRWGVSNTSTGGTGGGGAGKAVAGPLVFAMRASKASPAVALLCCTGKHLGTATLHGVRVSGTNRNEFLTITLTDVLVSSLDQHDSGGARPTETVELTYGAVKYVEDGHSMTFTF